MQVKGNTNMTKYSILVAAQIVAAVLLLAAKYVTNIQGACG
jgi:hypothetical protein